MKRWDVTLEADLGIRPKELAEHFFKPHWRPILIGQQPMMPILEMVFTDLGVEVSPQDFVDYWHGKDAAVREDVIAAAMNWQERTGGTLTLATNQEPVRAKHLWQDLNFKSHFDHLIVSCNVGAEKPEPLYFQRADEILGREPGQSVIFIDDLEKNVESARTHGWTSHLATSCDHAAALIDQL